MTKILVVLFVIFISGCSRKTYYRSYYQSLSYKNSYEYKKLKNQKMINTKAMQRATMRSYVVGGKRYYPTITKIGETFDGIASWYGPSFHARKTSNGELYNMYSLTAASKTLPMNTMVKVYNKNNGKSVIVRINDRGPFVEGRIIDLSKKAAMSIDMIKHGTAMVRLTVVGFNGKIAKNRVERLVTKSSNRYYLQVGAFSRLDGAKNVKRKFNNLILGENYKAIIKQNVKNGKVLNRVWISGFRSEEEAKDFKKQYGLKHAMIIAK